MAGISENANSKALIQQERKQVFNELIPDVYLRDYEHYADDIRMLRRIHRHPWAFRLVRFVERCLFKIEKRKLNL